MKPTLAQVGRWPGQVQGKTTVPGSYCDFIIDEINNQEREPMPGAKVSSQCAKWKERGKKRTGKGRQDDNRRET